MCLLSELDIGRRNTPKGGPRNHLIEKVNSFSRCQLHTHINGFFFIRPFSLAR